MEYIEGCIPRVVYAAISGSPYGVFARADDLGSRSSGRLLLEAGSEPKPLKGYRIIHAPQTGPFKAPLTLGAFSLTKALKRLASVLPHQ